MKTLLFIFSCGIICNLSLAATDYNDNANPLHRAEKALTDVIIHDIFSPPAASRIYVYANIAAYEVLVKYHTEYRSLYHQVKEFPKVPASTKKISSSLAAVYAFMLTGQKLVFSEPILEDSLNNILQWYHLQNISRDEFDASIEYGKLVSDSIMNWVAKDQYKETRKIRRYQFMKQEGKWIPTPPGYISAVEPYWNKIRPMTLDSCNQFQPPAATPFSKEKNSLFYEQAYEVYSIGKNLTDEQKAIAAFWDCNPFFLNTEGHLNFGTKKISPGGHWISIVNVTCNQTGADIMKASAAYTITSIALFDGFISCWDEKYRSNLVRPETYINATIDESWRPMLQTPPFPEYTSGHSVISTAAAMVLTEMFGDNFSFDDITEVEFGLPIRHFNSFTDACNEAAISRLYGGIHYRPAIENGQVQGKRIGAWVLQKIRLSN